MSDVPQVHTSEPLVPISDDDVAYRAKLPHWTLTEALFLLSGYRPPGYESTRHMQDHFWSAYHQAVRSIELGDLCRKIERAGEPHFIERPVRWLAWADSIGPEHIRVDERVRRALSQKPGTTAPTADAQPDATIGGTDEGKFAELSEPTIAAIGRRPASQSQTDKIWEAFDELRNVLTFNHGELARIAGAIAQVVGYKPNTVEKLIRDKYRELEVKQKQTST